MPSVSSRSSRARIFSVVAALVMLAGLFPAAVGAVAPSGAPTLLNPANGDTVSSNPVFSWTAVTGAAKYRVQISAQSDFSPLVYNVDTVNRKATPPADLPLGLLYWRVAGTDGGAGVGPYSEGTFTKEWGNAPVIDSPANLATFDFPTDPVLFDWQPLAGAKNYTLEIDNAADFIGATSHTTNNTSFTLTAPPTINQTYFWRLRATSSTGGVVSDWTATRQYTYTWLAEPQLQTPPDAVGTPLRDITFSWLPVVGAKTYELQISPNGDWTNNTIHTANVKSTKYNLPENINNGAYFWRVRAKDAGSPQNNGGWSDEWQFTRNWPQIPTIIAPAWNEAFPSNIPVVGEPILEWTPVPLASHYEVIIGGDPLFPAGSYATCFTNRTTLSPPYLRTTGTGGEPGSCGFSADPGDLEYWKVRAIDDTGNIIGIWSADDAESTYRFIYMSELPTLLTPADGATVQTPTLTWSAVDNIERYVVTIKKSSNGATVHTATTYATSYTPPALLTEADEPFDWYVTTIDGQGHASVIPATSDWFQFSLDPVTTDTSFDITSPANGASSVRMPKMTWDPFTGAAYYKVQYGIVGTGTFLVPPLSGATELKYAGFTYSGLPIASGNYNYYIEAYNASDVVIGESAIQTFVMSAPLQLGSSDYNSPPRCTLIATCTTLADTPTLEWDPVPGAGAYEITLSNDSEFTNEIKRYKTVYNTLTPRESFLDQQAGVAIYWFVKPCIDYSLTRCGPNAQTNANDVASAFRKNSAAVEMLTPTAGQTVADQITFNWTAYLATNQVLNPVVDQEARSYRIEVSQVSDFASTFDTLIVDQTTYTPFSKTYPEGPLFWRVQAIDGSGNSLTKSPIRQVNKSSPALTPTFPVNGSTQGGVPYFKWNPQAFAATYLIEVYKNGDTLFSAANKVLSQTTTFSAWSPTTSLASGVYAWRVRRNDADNRAGPWSAAQTFTLEAAKPTLTAPANGATVAANTLLFTWGGVAGAVQYRIEVAATCAFSTILFSQTTVMTSWAPITAYANGSYCWRVKALDAAGNALTTSWNTRTFNIGTAPPPPPTATTFVPIDPVRLLDSRFSVGLSGQFTANTARSVTIAGRLGIPNDAAAITANLTVVGQQQAGYLSVTPNPDNNPSTSALNFPLGDVRANNITSTLADNGKLSIVYRAGAGKKTHVLLDVTGYFLENNTGATFEAITPARLLDTRFANGLSGKFTSHAVRHFDVAGRGGVPANATAVTGNLTVVGQNDDGYVTLGPDLADNPATSTINFPLADTRANGITVRLNSTDHVGHLDAIYIAAPGKTTHLLFDVTGYYVQNLTGSKFYPLAPGRVLDSRFGTGLSGTFKTDIARALPVEGHVGVPVAADGITGNLTVVGQTAAGYVSMTKALDNTPATSTLNFPVGDVRANGVTGPLTAGGSVGLVYKASAGKTTHLILDITGYFAP